MISKELNLIFKELGVEKEIKELQEIIQRTKKVKEFCLKNFNQSDYCEKILNILEGKE